MEKLLTLKEALKLTGLSSKNKIKELIEKKLIKCEINNGEYRINHKYIDFILEYYKKINNEKVIASGIDFIESKLSDIDYIKDLFIEGVNKGHYKKELIENDFAFTKTVEALINENNDFKDENIVTIKTLICRYKKEKIGVITIRLIKGGVYEFWYFSLEEQYQSCGYGTQIIKKIEKMNQSLDKKHAIFMVRCSSYSGAMIHILSKLGYAKIDAKEKDWYLLFKSNDKNIKSEILNSFKAM